MNKLLISGFADEIDPQLDTQLQALGDFGVRWVELRAADGVNVSDFSPQKLKEVKSKLDAAGVRVSSVGSPIGKIGIEDDFAAHMEKLKRTLEIQKELEAPYLRMFSFYIPKGHSPQEYRGKVLEQVGAMAEEAARWESVLLHENEKGIYGDTAPRCRELMEELYGEGFKAVFDFANFVEVGQDTLEAYRLMRPYIEYIHVKDAATAPDGSKRIVPAGQGEGNVKEILERLTGDGWRGFLSLEPHLTDFMGLSALERDPEKRGTGLSGREAWELALKALRDIAAELPGYEEG